jgi:penicillin-binding protein 1A
LDTPKKTIEKGYGSTLALPVWAEVMKTADRLGYKASGIDSQLSFKDVRICRVSGRRATPACETAGEAYSDSIPIDLLPPDTDICIEHVETVPTKTGGNPPKAVAVDDLPEIEEAPRAIPVEDDVPRAIPVEEEVPRAIPVEP